MLKTLTQAGKELGQELAHTWRELSEGWRELLTRNCNALTSFSATKAGEASSQSDAGAESFPKPAALPRWSLLAGEVEETAQELVVRVEVPGMERADCHVAIEGNTLILSGEKHFERVASDSTYHVMERAYGAFERKIPLPGSVDTEHAEASYRNGVLIVRLPKGQGINTRTVAVT